MARWTDKDTFKLVHYTMDSCFHAIRPGVLNDHNQYSTCGEVLPIGTNGDVITSWYSNDYVNAQPISRALLAEMIRSTKPSETVPLLVVSIPEADKANIGKIVWCWMRLTAANAMQVARRDGIWNASTFIAPVSDKDPVTGFSSNSVIRETGTPRIYYDWREALAPITNYFKAVIRYCKDTGKARRLNIEAESQALNDRNATICAVVSKNAKRFKNISF